MENVPGRFKPFPTIGIVVLHGIAAYVLLWRMFTFDFSRDPWRMATINFSWNAWLALFFMWGISGVLGISVGYHRFMVHRAFTCRPSVEKALYLLAATALQGDGISWGETHTQHHAHPDKKGDPHRPSEFCGGLRGWFWSHMAWICFKIIPAAPGYEAPQHFRRNPALLWQKKYYWWLALSGLVFPYALAGWDGVLLAGFFRIVFVWHIIWSINSLCHIFGSPATSESGKVLKTQNARNFPLWCLFGVFGFISGGESWHANHHARQKSAYLGWRWYEIDPGRWAIAFFKKLGLVSDVRLPEKI